MLHAKNGTNCCWLECSHSCRQDQRICMQICPQMCFCVLCELGLSVQAFLSKVQCVAVQYQLWVCLDCYHSVGNEEAPILWTGRTVCNPTRRFCAHLMSTRRIPLCSTPRFSATTNTRELWEGQSTQKSVFVFKPHALRSEREWLIWVIVLSLLLWSFVIVIDQELGWLNASSKSAQTSQTYGTNCELAGSCVRLRC